MNILDYKFVNFNQLGVVIQGRKITSKEQLKAALTE